MISAACNIYNYTDINHGLLFMGYGSNTNPNIFRCTKYLRGSVKLTCCTMLKLFINGKMKSQRRKKHWIYSKNLIRDYKEYMLSHPRNEFFSSSQTLFSLIKSLNCLYTFSDCYLISIHAPNQEVLCILQSDSTHKKGRMKNEFYPLSSCGLHFTLVYLVC